MSQLSLQHNQYTEKITLFAEVLLPIHIAGTLTYRLPNEWAEHTRIGQRVVAPLGKTKVHTGIIVKIHRQAPKNYEARYLLELLDENPSVQEVQLRFFKWISQYYMCEEGDVLQVALPAGLKISSESKIQANPLFSIDESSHVFSTDERMLLEIIGKERIMSFEDVAKALRLTHIHGIVNRLVSKAAIYLIEEIKEKYQPKVVNKVRLRADFIPRQKLQSLFAELEKKPKQLEILMEFLRVCNIFDDKQSNDKGVAKKLLQTKELSASSLNTLIKKGIFEEFSEEVSRFEFTDAKKNHEIILTDSQQKAYEEILHRFEEKEVCLLHGVTGSGKTEIYTRLIQEVLQAGGQVLYLLPEIALTTQIVERLKVIFGKEMGVYHSRYSDNERVEVWNSVLEGRVNFIAGVRSSVFLPFNSLSLIIVDEEHEPSYKQYEPNPRYHARDSAVVLAQLHKAKVLMGTATPSFESYYNVKTNKYGLVELFDRYAEAQLPQIKLVDLKKEKKKKAMKEDYSLILLDELSKTLNEGKQAMLFQNRRGYAPLFSCTQCGWTPQCENCAVSLTYHMYRDRLQCHYCGHQQKNISECKVCGSSDIKMVGFGTEKLEDDLRMFMPTARIQRMDLDTTRKKYSYQQIIERFSSGDTDILIGTQMITKGLDFANVKLVGILNADALLYFPDFRAHERAYQLITQVSGRAGRKGDSGTVLIQTYTPEHSLFRYIGESNFSQFFQHEMYDRKTYLYPPYYRLINVIVKEKDKNTSLKAAELLYQALVKVLGNKRVMAVHEPIISKVKNQYIHEILMKLEKGIRLDEVKMEINKINTRLKTNKNYRKARVIFDVDPY